MTGTGLADQAAVTFGKPPALPLSRVLLSCVQCHRPQLKHQAPAVYADACRACHSRYYEGLFYDWMKSLDSRRNRAEDMLELMRDKDPLKAEALERKIDRAESTGFHNLGLTLKLWDEIEVGLLP